MNSERLNPECTDPQTGALLVSYALGTLGDREAGQFELHLLHCPACQQEMEAAYPALDTLASVREQFVLRARGENADFESQFERLREERTRDSSRNSLKNPRGRTHAIWTILLSRKWTVGVAGALAVAILFAIRMGKEPVPSPIVSNSVPLLVSPPSMQKRGIVPDSQIASRDFESETYYEKGSDAVSSPTRLQPKKEATEISADENRIYAPDLAGNSTSSGMEQTAGADAQIIDLRSESAVPMAAKIADKAIQPEPDHAPMSVRSLPTTEFQQLADAALGKLNPDEHMELKSEPRVKPSADISANTYYGYSAERNVVAKETITSDTTTAKSRHSPATDSANASLELAEGIVLLVNGDYGQARIPLERAFVMLPPGRQKDDIGLLLVRVDILSGRLGDARKRLQDFLVFESDSAKRELGRQALAKIDSFENASPQSPIPK